MLILTGQAIWPLGALGLMLITGIALIWRGLRGRQVDDHPICRRCGFDLFGKPEASMVCSECGADLTRPRAVQHGRRVRLVSLIVPGVLLLAAFLLISGGAAWMAVSSDWRQYAPMWYLLRDARSSDPSLRDGALTELSSRLSAGKLTQPQIDALADQALAIQGDKSKPWTPMWGDLIESAFAANSLSQPRWQQYLIQAPNLRLRVRTELRRGDQLPYWVDDQAARVGSKSALYVNYSVTAWTVGTFHSAEGGAGSSGSTLSSNGGGATGSSMNLTPALPQLKDGPQTLHFTLDMKIARAWNAASMASAKIDLSSQFKLHPENEPTVTINHDPSHRAGVEKALTCQNLEYGHSWNPKLLSAGISIANVPVGVGYDVFAVIGGKEVKLGSFACPKGTKDHSWGVGSDVAPFAESAIDLVLKPSVDAALGTVDTFEIWDSSIVIKNVTVKKMPTTTPAAPPAK